MSMETVEQEVLERLSVFAGGFMLEAAQAVCADDPIHHDEIPHLLSHLVDRSLVEVDQTEKEQRYRLSEELRAAVHERLVARGQAKKCHLTLVNYLYELAKQGWGRMSNGGERFYGFEWCVPLGPEGIAWFNKQEQELDNLRGAFRWLVDQGEVRRGLTLANILITIGDQAPRVSKRAMNGSYSSCKRTQRARMQHQAQLSERTRSTPGAGSVSWLAHRAGSPPPATGASVALPLRPTAQNVRSAREVEVEPITREDQQVAGG